MESGGVKDKIRFFLLRANTNTTTAVKVGSPPQASSSTPTTAAATAVSAGNSSCTSPSPPSPSSPFHSPACTAFASAGQRHRPRGSSRLGSSSSHTEEDSLGPPSSPSVISLFPSTSPHATLLESERKSRFIRNLRFFKEASKRHINDFHQSPAGSKYRSSSSPDIHQQLTKEEGEQLKLAGWRAEQQQQENKAASADTSKGKEKEDLAERDQLNEEDSTAVIKKRSYTLLPDFQCSPLVSNSQTTMSDSMIPAIAHDNKPHERSSSGYAKSGQDDSTSMHTQRPSNIDKEPSAAGMQEQTSESRSTSTTQTGSSSQVPADADKETRNGHVHVEQKYGQSDQNAEIEKANLASTEPVILSPVKSHTNGEDSSPVKPETTVTFKTPYPVVRRKSVGESPEGTQSGTAIMYKTMSDGATQHGLKQSSSDSNSVSPADSGDKDTATANGSDKKQSDGERKRPGGLIARYKNLVANIDKDKERNADLAKSLTESAVARKKKREKERGDKEKSKEEDKDDSEKESESRRKRRHSTKKEKPGKKEELANRKKQSAKSGKKKKKKTKESSEGSGKKEKRTKKELGGARTNSSIKVKGKDDARVTHSDHIAQRQPEIDEKIRELLRKLSVTPPPPRTNGDIGVRVIRRRLMTGDPFTVVLHSDMSWPSAGRGTIAKPSRTLGSKSSRIDSDSIRRFDSAEGGSAIAPVNDPARPRPVSFSVTIATRHDSSGRESGSGKEERKAAAPLSASMPAKSVRQDSLASTRADIRLFGVDGQLVIEESEDDEDWNKEFVGDKKGSQLKLSSPGGILDGLVVEESDEEDWGSAMAESANSVNRPSPTQAESEEENEDWEKEFASMESSPKTSRNVKEDKAKPSESTAITASAADSESEEDWDKELEEEAKKSTEKNQEAITEMKKPLTKMQESEDEDWEKDLVGQSKADEKKASEEDDEDWAKEFDEQENDKSQGSGAKRNGIALNLEQVKQQNSLSKWEESDDNDWGCDEPTSKAVKPPQSAGSENGGRSGRTVNDTEGEDDDWTKVFGDGTGPVGASSGKPSAKLSKKTGSKRQMKKEEKAKAKEKGKEEKESSKRASLGVASVKGSKREKRKRTKSSAAARKIEFEGRQPSPHSTTSTPPTPRSVSSSRASSSRSLRDEEPERKPSDLPPKGTYNVFKVQYLHSRSPKWIERERCLALASDLDNAHLDGDKIAASTVAVANMSIMASFSSFLTPRIPSSKKETVARLGRSNRDLSTPNSRDGSTLSSSTSAVGPYVPYHPPSFETIGWDPVCKQWSRRLCRAHYVDDLTVTLRLLNEDLILIYDQVFRFDGRGVLYSWTAGSKVRETNFYDVYAALIEKEGESGEEVGYIADL